MTKCAGCGAALNPTDVRCLLCNRETGVKPTTGKELPPIPPPPTPEQKASEESRRSFWHLSGGIATGVVIGCMVSFVLASLVVGGGCLYLRARWEQTR